VLRSLCHAPGLADKPEPEVHFNFLGDVNEMADGRVFRLVSNDHRPPPPGENRGAVLAVDAHVTAGRVVLNWEYSSELHHARTIEALARNALAWLDELVARSGN
jgi:non-ribosomal peptide synthase protein (TIGR01720 family)